MTTWTGFTRAPLSAVPRRGRAAALLTAFLAPIVAIAGVALLLGAAKDALALAGAPTNASVVLGVVALASAVLLLVPRAAFAAGLAAAIVSGSVAALFARAGEGSLAVLPAVVAVLAGVVAALDIDGPFARRPRARRDERNERTVIVRRRVVTQP